MIKDAKHLLKEKLKWNPIPSSERDFSCENFSKDECYLRMNNFPEEPLWTLTYKTETVDFDDAPPHWDITYRNSS